MTAGGRLSDTDDGDRGACTPVAKVEHVDPERHVDRRQYGAIVAAYWVVLARKVFFGRVMFMTRSSFVHRIHGEVSD